jgi:hypothetical protein
MRGNESMDKTMRLTTMISWALALMAALVFFAVAQSSVAEAQTATATASPQASDDGNNGGNGGRGGQGGNGGDANKAGGDDGGNFSQSNEQNKVVQDSICTNVEQATANQYKADDQAAGAQADDVIGDENSTAEATNIANALGINKRQVDPCLNEVDIEASSSAASVSAASTSTASVSTASTSTASTSTASVSAASVSAASVSAASVSATPTATVATGGGSASAAAGGTLPATGGGYTSALSVGMGALLIAGGLLARRIVR